MQETNLVSLPLETEAMLMRAVTAVGVPVPTVLGELTVIDTLPGRCFAMEFLQGETIGIKVIQMTQGHESTLTNDIGATLALLHAAPTEHLQSHLRTTTPLQELQFWWELLEESRAPLSPGLAYVFEYLRANVPPPPKRLSVVHGAYSVLHSTTQRLRAIDESLD